jgi:hypothetical protein
VIWFFEKEFVLLLLPPPVTITMLLLPLLHLNLLADFVDKNMLTDMDTALAIGKNI